MVQKTIAIETEIATEIAAATAIATVTVIVTQRLAPNLLSMSFGMPVSYTYSKEGRRSYYASFARVSKRTRTRSLNSRLCSSSTSRSSFSI